MSRNQTMFKEQEDDVDRINNDMGLRKEQLTLSSVLIAKASAVATTNHD